MILKAFFSTLWLSFLIGSVATSSRAESAAAEDNTTPKATPATSVKVLLTTNQGDITVELNAEKAPISVANFVQYVESGFYAGTVFHRVMDGFMIQGGGFTENMQKKPTQAAIKNEASNGLSNDRYTLAMARTSDPDSATAQFYINLKDNHFLNKSGSAQRQAGYAVFGKVVAGQDVVDRIAKATTRPMGPHQHVPETPIIIEQATVLD